MMKIRYPWERLEPGEGFFIPCLDVHNVREQGLNEALRKLVYADAYVGIKDGRLGVWFYRPHAPVPRGRSSPAGSR